MKLFLRACSIWSLFLLSVPDQSIAQSPTSRPSLEYQVKASLIFNFIQYVRWPPAAADDDVRLCVVGPDRFGAALNALDGQVVEGNLFIVVRLLQPKPEQLHDCRILFVSNDRQINQVEVLSMVKDVSVLTIGESPTFMAAGGIISLQTDNDKVVFDVNRTAARNARLEISSKLLRLARTVQE